MDAKKKRALTAVRKQVQRSPRTGSPGIASAASPRSGSPRPAAEKKPRSPPADSRSKIRAEVLEDDFDDGIEVAEPTSAEVIGDDFLEGLAALWQNGMVAKNIAAGAVCNVVYPVKEKALEVYDGVDGCVRGRGYIPGNGQVVQCSFAQEAPWESANKS